MASRQWEAVGDRAGEGGRGREARERARGGEGGGEREERREGGGHSNVISCSSCFLSLICHPLFYRPVTNTSTQHH